MIYSIIAVGQSQLLGPFQRSSEKRLKYINDVRILFKKESLHVNLNSARQIWSSFLWYILGYIIEINEV